MAITRALRARVVRLPHPIPCSLNHCSILPRSHPHVPPQSRHHPAALDVPSILFEAREPSATRFPMSSMLMSGS
jgi:hypothetical protein